MPICDYQCSACDHQDEVMRKASDANTTVCPECEKETFTKMLSALSFQLSGTGWYATDFKNSGKSASAKKQKPTTEKKDKPTDTATTSCEPGCGYH